jgi:PQQ-dependent catabolism-associated beta-propeller protein
LQAVKTLALALALLAAAPAGAETVYVSNEQDNTISVIDGVTFSVAATIAVGRRPRGIALSPDRRRLFVAIGDDDRIDVVDLAARKVVDVLPSGEDPELFAVHPDGKRLFVANENDNQVTVIDIAQKKIVREIEVGVEPEGMAVSPDGTLVVCTSETTSMAHFIDAGTYEVVDNVLVDTRPRMAAFTPDAKQVWVSSELRGTVSVLGAERREVEAIIEFAIPGVPRELVQAVGIALARDGRAYVALGPANRVAEIDMKSLKVLRYYLVGQRVWHIALSLDEKRLYSANGNSGDVTVIDLERRGHGRPDGAPFHQGAPEGGHRAGEGRWRLPGRQAPCLPRDGEGHGRRWTGCRSYREGDRLLPNAGVPDT